MTAGGGIVAYNPLANDDTATTPQNTPVTITILSNDVGYVFNLDPSTIDLDPSSPGQQTTLTVPGEGTYTVNLTTGEVTFTPDPSFTGAATPIQYTVKDAQGLISNEATITVTVTPASTPTPTPTPTETPTPTPTP
ncbi:Ig-like domain-containing protein, partial [Synechococcus sp. OH2]